MPNYQNGKIYKLIADETEKVYVGSTAKKYLCQRMANHRSSYKAYQAGKDHYVSSFEILQHPNVQIILLESFPCKSKDELLAREEYWRKKIDNDEECVNKVQAIGRSEDSKQKTFIRGRIRVFCDCGGKYKKSGKSCHIQSKRHQNYVANQVG